MKAIRTRYDGPTNTRGSRVSATDHDGNRISVPYSHEHDADTLHKIAAARLAQKMGWKGSLQGGHWAGDMIWTWVDDRNRIEV